MKICPTIPPFGIDGNLFSFLNLFPYQFPPPLKEMEEGIFIISPCRNAPPKHVSLLILFYGF
jgi:hypothetical protein